MHLGEFSIICFEFLGDFWRKSQKEKRRKNWAKKKSGHFVSVKGQKRPPRVRQGVTLLRRGKVLRRSEGIVHKGKIFGFLFRKPSIRTPVV